MSLAKDKKEYSKIIEMQARKSSFVNSSFGYALTRKAIIDLQKEARDEYNNYLDELKKSNSN